MYDADFIFYINFLDNFNFFYDWNELLFECSNMQEFELTVDI